MPERRPTGLSADWLPSADEHPGNPVPPFEDLLQSNAEFAARFPYGDLGPLPTRRLAVLTCMDCRIDVHEAFGLAPGEAHVLRNAGARASDDAIRSLIKSTIQLEVNRIAVVHHTDCGAAKIELDALRRRVVERTGNDPVDIDFQLIADQGQSIVDDVDRLRTSPYLPPGTALGGFLYDVGTGQLELRVSCVVGGSLELAEAHS